ncbi:putative tetratricopeptide-like helical domain superfamily, DYW domain-containing protein [Helianthus annuus]|uniref:Putative pentatricopeptide repeat (PPR) superfamily protein n=1 Tax=Helianthus annuus TaxID=4232 RepID=A0A251SVF3_HELAN|nr:pentatricopeptide repeat-containing protein At4g37170 [Helianthus annuus]KAF5773421.1 putative tetratricopeptide-like helical domain superfamily, DYW domain-containing protein [Helianthus annuus]KAJ0476912.1 putative tetratricopeptide-like helical domain superfamily, DYW domain-containing protein [Helianthus annuus]KAJ0481261.1 putative tetratricopeptide-like helical domain superfamily, DYW domain-containing protein [Helianthus annuus]KAJ0497736.1 putative tetratricopeptide-like helical doma
MRSIRPHFRALITPHQRIISTSSSETLSRTPNPQKTFFKSQNKHEEAIINLCQKSRLTEAIQLLDRIEHPSSFIYSNLLQLCVQQRALEGTKRVHSHIKRSNFLLGVSSYNRILDIYCKCGSLVDARKVFDEMPERDLCSWNTMVSGYAKAGRLKDARNLFDEMPERDNFSWTAIISGYVRHGCPNEALRLCRAMLKDYNVRCNKFTVCSALAASAATQSLTIGKEIHGHIVRTGIDSDAVVWSALSDMYGKCGSLDEARHIFDKTSDKDVVTWTAMIDRYFKSGRREEGFLLFSELLRSGNKPNEFTFAGILNVCALYNLESLGRQVHGYMARIGFNQSSFAASALIHMYCRCGNTEIADRVFKWVPNPDLASWTSLINGYAQNGQPEESLKLFEALLESGTKPDHITFVGVLSACTHSGLVDKGLEYFNSIKEKHGLAYTIDHYACVVDLLSRSGRFNEAEDIIKKMPMKPDKFLWASLLAGCRIHGNLDLAKRAAEALFKIEPENAATYVTLSNIYAAAGKWADVAKIRNLMDVNKVVKKPGRSWTEIKRKVYTFLMGDTSNPRLNEIHELLEELQRKIREEGYVPKTDYVLHDVEDEQKEQNLSYHSEKLAIAFAILVTPPGTSIKVFKNLRTCVDCHTFIKYVSKVVSRKIIVRDSSRFHCFEDGSCSCKDYW